MIGHLYPIVKGILAPCNFVYKMVFSTTMSDYLDIIKTKIENSGLSKRQVSLRSGLDETAVKVLYYNRARTIKLETVLALAKGLNCYPSELLPKEWQKPADIDKDVLSGAIADILKADAQDKQKATPDQLATHITLIYFERIKNKLEKSLKESA